MKKNRLILYTALAMSLFSCREAGQSANRKPIILGDSASIVTENNPKYLADMVQDLHPYIPEPSSGMEAKAFDTSQRVVESSKPKDTVIATKPVEEKGLDVIFKELKIFIAGIKTKQYKAVDLSKSNSAAYQLISGGLNGKQLQVSGGNVSKVSQRYTTVIVLKNAELGSLPLESLDNTTDWIVLKGKNNSYTISGLSAGRLESADLNGAILRNAISKAAHRHHLSRKVEKEWQALVRHPNANKRSVHVLLRNVMWKIDGKGTDGKAFAKLLRIDT